MAEDSQVFVGASKCFLDIVEKIRPFAACTATVLITGETGTGKELFARAIHDQGGRRRSRFVPVNCAALPDHLVENELFGHVRGAFTDAVGQKDGLLVEADGGTLFLDEVNSLSLGAQGKLLRFLQDRAFRPLGSTKDRVVDVRVVAATNHDLRMLVQGKLFREDLFHRLNVLSICIPPVRKRMGDIPLLARHFLRIYAERYGRGPCSFSSAAMDRLLAYDWPGNVREVESVVQRAVVLTPSQIIRPEDIDLPTHEEGPKEGPAERGVTLQSAHSSESRRAAAPFDSGETLRTLQEVAARYGTLGLTKAKEQVLEQFERAYLRDVLENCGGNVSKAARVARKERRSFQRLIQKYGLDRRNFQKTA